MTALEKIRASRGLGAKITRELGLSRGAISQWSHIPAERVIDVERITGMKRQELRPDLYPPEISERSEAAE